MKVVNGNVHGTRFWNTPDLQTALNYWVLRCVWEKLEAKLREFASAKVVFVMG